MQRVLFEVSYWTYYVRFMSLYAKNSTIFHLSFIYLWLFCYFKKFDVSFSSFIAGHHRVSPFYEITFTIIHYVMFWWIPCWNEYRFDAINDERISFWSELILINPNRFSPFTKLNYNDTSSRKGNTIHLPIRLIIERVCFDIMKCHVIAMKYCQCSTLQVLASFMQ